MILVAAPANDIFPATQKTLCKWDTIDLPILGMILKEDPRARLVSQQSHFGIV